MPAESVQLTVKLPDRGVLDITPDFGGVALMSALVPFLVNETELQE
jgi:hypothetical protein